MAPATPTMQSLRFGILIFILGINAVSSGEYSGLLSKLYKKAAQENRPLILVLDNSSQGKANGLKTYEHTVNKEPRVDNLPLFHLDVLDQFQKKSPRKPNKSLKPYRDEDVHDATPRPRYRGKKSKLRFADDDRREDRDRREDWDKRDDFDKRDDDLREDWDRPEDWDRREDDRREDWDRREDRFRSQDRPDQAFRSLKSLLRISNSLRCRAKDKCQNSCGNKFKGKKLNQCENKCDIKYDCDESDKDPCDSESNDCGNEEGSTKGELFVTVTPKCKRC